MILTLSLPITVVNETESERFVFGKRLSLFYSLRQVLQSDKMTKAKTSALEIQNQLRPGMRFNTFYCFTKLVPSSGLIMILRFLELTSETQ